MPTVFSAEGEKYDISRRKQTHSRRPRLSGLYSHGFPLECFDVNLKNMTPVELPACGILPKEEGGLLRQGKWKL